MKTVLVPYLNFMGQAKPAIEFYKEVFGGEITMQTYKDAGFPHDPADDDLVIHAELKSDTLTIMVSDGNKEHQVTAGDNVYMSLIGTDETELKSYFDKLSEGGKADMPLAKQFWGDTYGQLTDKFGIHWAINISSPDSQDLK